MTDCILSQNTDYHEFFLMFIHAGNQKINHNDHDTLPRADVICYYLWILQDWDFLLQSSRHAAGKTVTKY